MSVTTVNLLDGTRRTLRTPCSPDDVFYHLHLIYPDRVAYPLLRDASSCEVLFVGRRVVPRLSYCRIRVAARQCYRDLQSVSLELASELLEHLCRYDCGIQECCLAYVTALRLWELCADASIRTIGCMSNILVRLETTLVLHIGASRFSWLPRYLQIPEAALSSLKRRHQLMSNLSVCSSDAQEDHFNRMWGILSKREMDDLQSSLAILDVRDLGPSSCAA